MSAEAPLAVAPVDQVAQQYLDALATELGSGFLGGVVQREDAFVRVELADWTRAVTVARKLGLTYFCFLSGLDWLDSPLQTTRYENVWGTVDEEPADDAERETAAPEPVVEAPAGLVTGLAGGASRFQVFCRLYSTETRRGLVIKADLDDANPTVPSITKIFAGADWHERETWEMYGFWFEGHPHLVHLYLPMAFEGYPLRKDFPLLAREVKPWPGLTNVEPIAGEVDEEAPAEA